MRSSIWNFIDTGPGPGKYNMDFDERIARDLAEKGGHPTLRFYGWQPWAISLGYNQNDAEIDMDRCSREGVDVVRRPTGGRAILHAEELTYSVVMHADRKGIHQIYNEISHALVKGLRLFGVDVSLQKSQPNFPELYRNASSIPCFSSSARYEIEWDRKKLVGSAQRRYAFGSIDVVLQHGSILLGSAHRRLVDYLVLNDPEIHRNIVERLEHKTTDLSEASGKGVDLEDLVDCMKQGFEESFGASFVTLDRGTIKRDVYV
jgi:lipoyl(octanoyl) transferase